mmetsp:Transcript_25241/g.45700  ORF Transcript_25241/g.45700 Transcript_25241/m.45700 type:complete len:150 (-) Transcript_25241:142-591(-)
MTKRQQKSFPNLTNAKPAAVLASSQISRTGIEKGLAAAVPVPVSSLSLSLPDDAKNASALSVSSPPEHVVLKVKNGRHRHVHVVQGYSVVVGIHANTPTNKQTNDYPATTTTTTKGMPKIYRALRLVWGSIFELKNQKLHKDGLESQRE